MKTCPEMPDLLDHLEGRADHASHVAVCEPCASALSDLRSVLRVELANVAVPALDVERALESVHARARAGRVRRWRGSFLFSAVAAAALFFLLPAQQISGPRCEGPRTPGTGPGALVPPAMDTPVGEHTELREMLPGIPASLSTTAVPITSSQTRR